MKLNKKECRRYANPELTMPPDHGLLYAPQVDYIVHTEVKVIDHHRTLILFVYPRAQAAQGDFRPLWTVFHSRDNYITLAHNPDGTTKWRTAAFEHLSDDYYFVSKCAFYSARDQERVSRYFNDDSSGFAPLLLAQSRLLGRRLEKRLQERDRKVRARMRGLPALPCDLERWAHQTLLPAYFFYDRARGGRAFGRCSSCGQDVTLTGVRHNATLVCPRCGNEIVAKARGRRGWLEDRTTGQVIQKNGPNELVVRILKAYCYYKEDTPTVFVYENARQFIQVDQNRAIQRDNYYLDNTNHWKQGVRPSFYPYQYNFEADDCGHVYCRNLSRALMGTPWQYCPIQAYYEHFHEPMQMYPFLAAHLKHSKLEHLVKVGFYNLACDLAYHGNYDRTLDEAQDRTHRLLRVGAEDVAFLRALDVNMSALKIFQEYCQCNLKNRQRLLEWQVEQDVEDNIVPILEHMTAHKLMRYLNSQYSFLQFRLTPQKNRRYGAMQNLVTEYKDYLDMCEKQRCDMTNSFVLFPRDLQKAHDKLTHQIQLKADAKLRREFKASYQRVMGQLDFEFNGMKIVYPATPEDIVAEGNALHHCVGGYVDRVAQQKTMILFLRRCENLSKPFYTVEVCHRRAVQVRGMQNAGMTPEVKQFMDRWERQVLQGQEFEAAA